MQKKTFLHTLFSFFSSLKTKISPDDSLKKNENKKPKPRRWSNTYYKDFWEHCES